jgi:NitT/TauT family transport system permease protein
MNRNLIGKFLPLLGPIALLVLWSLAVESKWVKPVLLLHRLGQR